MQTATIVAAPIKLQHGTVSAGDVTSIVKIMENAVNVILTHSFCLVRIARTKHRVMKVDLFSRTVFPQGIPVYYLCSKSVFKKCCFKETMAIADLLQIFRLSAIYMFDISFPQLTQP